MTNGELTEKELKISSWWVTHKVLVRRIFVGLLIGICGALWGGSLVGWVGFGLEWKEYRAALLELANSPTPIAIIRQQRLPKDVIVESSAFVPAGGAQRYDFVATIRNPNERWLVQNMTVAFQAGGKEYPALQDFFILPQSVAAVTSFNVQVLSSGASFSEAVPVIKDIQWKRVDAKTAWRDVRFSVDDVAHGVMTQDNKKPTAPKTFVSAKITNQSPYDFWNVRVPILLYDTGGKLIAANVQNMAEFNSFEVRGLNVQFPYIVPNIAKVDILPTVNIFNLDNYISPEEKGGQLP